MAILVSLTSDRTLTVRYAPVWETVSIQKDYWGNQPEITEIDGGIRIRSTSGGSMGAVLRVTNSFKGARVVGSMWGGGAGTASVVVLADGANIFSRTLESWGLQSYDEIVSFSARIVEVRWSSDTTNNYVEVYPL